MGVSSGPWGLRGRSWPPLKLASPAPCPKENVPVAAGTFARRDLGARVAYGGMLRPSRSTSEWIRGGPCDTGRLGKVDQGQTAARGNFQDGPDGQHFWPATHPGKLQKAVRPWAQFLWHLICARARRLALAVCSYPRTSLVTFCHVGSFISLSPTRRRRPLAKRWTANIPGRARHPPHKRHRHLGQRPAGENLFMLDKQTGMTDALYFTYHELWKSMY